MSVVFASSAVAQVAPTPARLDSASLAAFADGILPSEMARRQIPGAVLAVVHQGRVALVRAYGFADLESRTQVDPERTRFFLASVTKVVTATAALQLVERGELVLTANVNARLRGFGIDPYRGDSVTLHHLLTHTAGFEERLTGNACRSESEREPLRTYLSKSMPRRIARAGEVLSYSNHGMSLVALLVEQASGQAFENYVREQILASLGMRRSDFLTSSEAAADVATAYQLADGRPRRQPPDCLRTVGAGGLATTGTDMAHFLIAHLEGGVYDGARIMRTETVDRMHERQFSLRQELSGWAYGFWEDVRNGERGLMHDGGGNGYRALVYLLPNRRLGFFLAYNLADRHADGELLDVFRRRFLTAYAPAPTGPDSVVDSHLSANVDGYYRYVRRARTTMEKFISVANVVRIDENRDGRITMTAAGSAPMTLVPIGRGVFRRSDDRGLVAFDAVDDHGPQRLILDGGGLRMYERVSALSTLPVQGLLLAGMALAFVWAAVVRPASRVVRSMRRHGSQVPGLDAGVCPPSSRLMMWFGWLTEVASALNLLFMLGFPLVFLGDVSSGVPAFLYGVPRVALFLLAIPPVTAALAVASAVAVGWMWRDRRQRFIVRLERTIVSVALLAFVPFTLYWHLMGIQR